MIIIIVIIIKMLVITLISGHIFSHPCIGYKIKNRSVNSTN